MKTALTSILFLASSATCALAAAPCDHLSEYPVRFAILGDRTGSHQDSVYEEIVAEIVRIRPDFVMTVGDMIEGYTSDTVQMRKEWEEYLGIIRPLPVPIRYTPGNHDITSDAMEPMYRQVIGNPHHSFDIRGIHFVIVDNSRWEAAEELPKAQIEWLESDLQQNSSACYTFVFMHKPFWYRTLGDGQPDILHDMFKAHGVDAVITGHFHKYFSGEFDGIRYTSLGSSGGATEESPDGLLYHFGWVTVDGDGIHLTPIKKDAVLPWAVQTVAEMRASNKTAAVGLQFAEPVMLRDGQGALDDTVTVRLSVEGGVTPFSDSLRWEVPEGWTVTPATLAYTLGNEAPAVARFVVKSGVFSYPLPTVSARLPYGHGKSVTVNRTLEVARAVECAGTDERIAVDGILTEKCWRAPRTILYGDDGKAGALDSTAFFFAQDARNLYVAAYCRESRIDSLRSAMTERDAAVYTEDAVGWMFRPDSDAGHVYQVYVNPAGTVYDQHIERRTDGDWQGSPQWNGEYEVKTTRGADYFAIEMRIPLEQFKASAKEGDRWRVNFRRKQFRLKASGAFQAPWSYDPSSFGELVFR